MDLFLLHHRDLVQEEQILPFLELKLTDPKDRDKSQQELYDEFSPVLSEYPAAEAFAFPTANYWR